MGLMRLRNAVVRRLGLRAASGTAPTRPAVALLHPGDPAGTFQTYSAAPKEVVPGLDDKHLDFRVSVLLEAQGPAETRVWVSTAVQFHNAFGRFYFAVIKPFHGLVVRALLRHGQARLAAL